MAADGTLLSLAVAPGPGGLQPVGLRGTEAISAPFLFEVDMISSQSDLDPDGMLFKPVCVALTVGDAAPRHFHGMVRACSAGAKRGAAFLYRAEVVPKLWFLAQTADCRIFHSLSAVDIIAQVLQEGGVTDLQWKVQGAKPVREYTVQYNESDLAFITRLMQEEGYYYYFTHAASAHTLVIANKNVAFEAVGEARMRVREEVGADAICNWRGLRQTVTGKVQVRDYDPLNPAQPVTGNQNTVLATAGATQRDQMVWPALTASAEQATAQARRRQEAAEALAQRMEGDSANPTLVPGGKFTLEEGDFAPGQSGEFAVQLVAHQAVDEVHANTGGFTSYANGFVCFPVATEWREALSVERPRMVGVHTAVVLGPAGEEIAVDEHFRVKVRLFWDHRADATHDNTIWVRVMQPWAGNGWGMQHIPRVGTEVAVAFVNGDPDHPIVLGALYNGQMKPPFPLPAEKTKSGIKTRSSLKGGTGDFNELFFDDKKGSELFSMHAQKDMKVVVENDQTTHVMHDVKITVDNCRIEKVKVDETIGIDGKQALTVKGDRTTEISQGKDTLNVKMGDVATEVGMGNVSLLAKMGNISTKASLGKINDEAMQAIELKVGSSSIKIDQMGVTIKGMMVKVEGTIMTEVKGLMTKVDGSAMTMVKGAITMIG